MTKIETLRCARDLCLDFVTQKYCYEYFMEKSNILYGSGSYYILLTNNHFDMAVMAWGKVFGNKNDHFHFKRVLKDPKFFKNCLLQELGIGDSAWCSYWKEMKDFRDQFVAHRDNIQRINVPNLSIANKSVTTYYSHLVQELMLAGQTTVIYSSTEDYINKNGGYFRESIDKIADVLAHQANTGPQNIES